MKKTMTFELADTGAMTTTDGYSSGGYINANQLFPIIFLRDVVDAAKKLHFAAQFAYQTEVTPGNKDVVIPIRTKWIGSGTTWSASVAEATAVNFTNINTSALPMKHSPGSAKKNLSVENISFLKSGLRNDLLIKSSYLVSWRGLY